MNKLLVSLVLTLGVATSAHALEGNAEAGQGKVAVCGACHGADGNSPAPNFPKLAGQGEQYLLKQITDIKEGRRTVVEMTGMLDGLNEQDLADIAAYFASQSMTLGAADPALAERGVLYAPDYVINAGGIINISFEGASYDRDGAMKQTGGIYDTLMEVFERAEADAAPTNEVADRMARERIAEAKGTGSAKAG